jgi:hypothetical protein
MARLDAEFGEFGFIFQLSAFYQNLLPLWFDASKRVKLEFEGFAIRAGIEFDIVFLALMLDND